MNSTIALSIPLMFFSLTLPAVPSETRIPDSEFVARREKAMQAFPDGILLLQARNFLSGEDQLLTHGFHQRPNFYYFTGLGSALNAILAIDAIAGESRLFVPPKPAGVGSAVNSPWLQPGAETAAHLNLDAVVPWDAFESFIDERLRDQPNVVFYTDESTWSPLPPSVPGEMFPVDNPYTAWRVSLQQRWPELRVESVRNRLLQIRAVKSEHEIAVIRDVARVSAAALRAGIKAIEPGKSQREVEAEIVCECIKSGGEGPSFWPWVMAGENAVIPRPFESLVDYFHLNRTMQAGELVRVDIGCDVDFYMGDVGRTVPVSGWFDDGQRETWDLFVAAYHAGLSAMRDGVPFDSVKAASEAEVAARSQTLTTFLARKAATLVAARDASVEWHHHTSGLEPGEGAPPVLKAGMIIEFEPMIAVDGEAFYLEDMILITADGHEVLTTDVPYMAAEIEALMSTGETN